MKRALAGILILMMVFACVPGLAEVPAVDERFFGQLSSYAMKGTVTFSVSGDSTSLVAQEVFPVLKDHLPGMTISFGHSMFEQKYPGGYVRFSGEEGEEKEVLFAYNKDVLALGGNTVSDDDTWYAADMDVMKLLGLFEEKENVLPGIREIAAAIEKADDEWKAQALNCLASYETALSIWMSQYAATQTGRDGENLYTELACEIPTDAVKAELRGLLRMFYGDTELLALLSQVLDPIGAGIYLNPAMEGVLGMLAEEAMPEGKVQVVRRFDAQGALVLDKIILPLPAFEQWQDVQLEMTGKGDLGCTLANAEGKKIVFSLAAGEQGAYTGRAVLENVLEGQPHVGFSFEAVWQEMDETYSLQTDKLERLKQGVLTLTPDEQTPLPAQKITLDVAYSSGSRERGSVTMVADLVWTDLETGAALAAEVKAKTVNRFEVQKVENLQHILYFSDLPLEQRQALLNHILLAPFEEMWAAEAIAE